ncbi:hypothetical protein [Bacillus thuringiensis]|nr:hypothetical protein [Bacillus thuringiensis]MED3275742.1 hypothetical protein [Bacillus thuringiensis]
MVSCRHGGLVLFEVLPRKVTMRLVVDITWFNGSESGGTVLMKRVMNVEG